MIGCYDNHFMMPLDCNECTFKTECSIYNELAEVRKELNRWKQSAEEVLRVASAKEEQDGKAN